MHSVRSIFLGSVSALALLTAGVAAADHPAVKVATKEGVGAYLVDARGMALYTFKKDAPGKSACEGDCLVKWPAFDAEPLMTAAGLKAEDFSRITRADGAKQAAYKGMPLYFFAADKAAGDTGGQGMKGVWTVAAP
jgi:predicted lipoprotein with Yx(FWY)xxD motif